ncbi:MAG TPA: autotransporter domain-containing protein, partial [Pseudomonadales bacterium]|nr:autotransporter domain-containing protein [Pseudomonadales bacterium]
NFSLQARTPVPGTFEFGASSYTVKEESGKATILVNRTNGTDGVASVTVSTQVSRASNAATPNQDFIPLNQPLTFAAGESQKSVEVDVVQDAVQEGEEVVQLVFSNPSAGASVGANATLTITDATGFSASSGLSQNQAAVATALDQACPTASGALAQRCAELVGLNESELKNALDQIAPGALFGEGSQAMQITQVQLLNLRNRLNVVRMPNGQHQLGNLNLDVRGEMVPLASIGRMVMDQGGSAGEEDSSANSPWGVFVNGRLNVGRKDARNNLDPGFKFENQNITFGADYRRSDKLVLGGAIGYATSNTDIGRDRGSLDMGAWYVSQYGNWYPVEALYVDWVATVGKADYDSVRKIAYSGFSSSADSNTDGKQYSVSVSLGSDVANGAWQWGSYARLDWAKATIDPFSERGGDGLALSIAEQQTRQNTFVLGAKASRAISWRRGVIIPGVFLEGAHELQDASRKVTASFVENAASEFSVETSRPDANYFNYGFNLVSVFTQGRSAFFNVQGVAGMDGRTSYVYEAGGRFEF